MQWLATDGEQKEVILHDEPESTFWQRFYNNLIGPFVPEVLL